MKTVDKIIETFKDEEEIMLICSEELALKLNQEIDDLQKTVSIKGVFKNETMIDYGIRSIGRNGVTLHYTSDLERLVNGLISNNLKNI